MSPLVNTKPSAIADRGMEDFAAGSILLGYPWPDWLSPEHFTQRDCRLIFQAARELGARAALPTVAALLRDQGDLFNNESRQYQDRLSRPHVLDSLELVDLLNQADWAMGMGWAVEWDRLRERECSRRLVEAMQRAEVQLESEMVFSEAKAMLMEIEGAR